MNRLHTLTGFLAAWLLFIVFFTGTLSYFKEPITAYMLQLPNESHSQRNDLPEYAELIERMLANLTNDAPNASNWLLYMPEEKRTFAYSQYSQRSPDGNYTNYKVYFDPYTLREIKPRGDSAGGDFFFGIHYQLFAVPGMLGMKLVGILALLMLVGLISGLAIHYKKFKKLVSLLPNNGNNVPLNVHVVTAFWGLPFYIVICVSGLAALAFSFMSMPVKSAFENGVGDFFNLTNPSQLITDKRDLKHAQGATMSAILAHAQDAFDGHYIDRIIVKAPMTERSIIRFYGRPINKATHQRRVIGYELATGTQVVDSRKLAQTYPQRVMNTLIGLHAARFSDFFVKSVFALGGIFGCVLLATGSLIFIQKYNASIASPWQQRFYNATKRISIGVYLGLPIATLCYFYANRFNSASNLHQAELEQRIFYISFSCVIVFSLWFTQRFLSQVLLLLVGALAVCLPLVSATLNQVAVFQYLSPNENKHLGFYFVVVSIGIVSLYGGYRLMATQRQQ